MLCPTSTLSRGDDLLCKEVGIHNVCKKYKIYIFIHQVNNCMHKKTRIIRVFLLSIMQSFKFAVKSLIGNIFGNKHKKWMILKENYAKGEFFDE